MRGLVIWAYSECRSMMGLYRELIRQAKVPVIVAPYHHHSFAGYCTARTATGFKQDEFSDVPMLPVGDSWEKGIRVLDEHPGYCHLFAVYQGASNFRRLMSEIRRRGERFGVICESPCNMSVGIKGFLKKNLYFKYILPRSVKSVVREADFFINLSGDGSLAARRAGWPAEKIIPWGYYSPIVPGSQCVKRNPLDDFTILVTGLMTWHRGPDVVIRALGLLTNWGVKYKAVITQRGPLFAKVQQYAEERNLPVEFPGLVPMADLVRMYESCNVYVGAGRNEPWGMRLNDALQCGAPLAVSRGMGGVKLVEDYGCGVGFANEDYVDLARKLRHMIEDKEFYAQISDAAYSAAEKIKPEVKARQLLEILNGIW